MTTLPLPFDSPLLQAVRAVRAEACAPDPYAFTLTEVAHFTVVGIPVAQPRGRARVVHIGNKTRAQITTAQREHPVHQWTACLCATKSIYTSLAARVTNNLL